MDTITLEQRHKNMTHIRSTDTKPEEIVRKYLFSHGFRYRKYVKTLPGKPDIVLPKYKTVILVNGCFWHQHPGCKAAVIPKSNVDFWTAKLQRNITRDLVNQAQLNELGWRVIVVWECELSNQKKREERLTSLVDQIRQAI